MPPGLDGLAQEDVRAARFAALGDPARLAIVDELVQSDRSPVELRHVLAMESNLIAHHLDVLEQVGLIERKRSSGDGRRRYVHLLTNSLTTLLPGRTHMPHDSSVRPTTALDDGANHRREALFVCTANSARSQLAAAIWRRETKHRADSAGTHPATRVHPGAIAAARRAGLDLGETQPQNLTQIEDVPALVVTVCDRAHEELAAADTVRARTWLHWSIPDPVAAGTPAAFDRAVADLTRRVRSLANAEL